MAKRNPYVVLSVLTLATMITSFVEAMVIPALPDIQTALSTTREQAAWIVSSYLVVGAAIAPLFGKMGDVFGKRKLYLLSLLFYTLAVLIASFSNSINMLIVARAIQGLGFSIFPLAIAIITDIFPKEKVATAQGIISSMIMIGTTVGLIAGAYIDQYFGWSAMFRIAFIASFIVLFLSLATIEPLPAYSKEKIDYFSTIILASGTALILIYLTEAPYKGWTSIQQILTLIFGGILFTGFYFYETKSPNPLIKLSTLKIRNVMVSNLAGLVTGIVMFMMYLGVIYFAEEPPPYGLGVSVISAALSLLPTMLAMIFIAPLIGSLTSRLGPKPLLIYGSLVTVIGFTTFLFYRNGLLELMMDSFITGIGMISMMIPIINMVALSVPQSEVSVGLGFNTMIRFLGSSIGPVLTATLMTDYKGYAIYVAQLGRFSFFVEPSSMAYNYIFIIGIILSLVRLVIVFYTKNYRLKK